MATADVSLDFDVEEAIGWLMRVLAVKGVTGREKAVGEEVVKILREVGVPGSDILFDRANEQIPLPTETGNLVVKLKGNRRGPRRLFATHLDTVPLCAGAVPVRKGGRIVPQGETALGGDNRTGVACLIALAANLLRNDLPHPPTTLLFTVREESGLWGARFVNLKDLGKVEMCFNVDGREPWRLGIAAVGADRWSAEIRGKASHAGAYPQEGVSATMVAALALAEVKAKGYFGKVNVNGKSGTSNVGVFGGKDGRAAGEATNVVTDYVYIRGESRSHDEKFIGEITRAYRDAFLAAAKQVTDDKGRGAKVKFEKERDYYPFKLDEQAPVVQTAMAVARALGMEPEVRAVNGGLDANWLVRHGIPAVTFGAGQNNIHTVNEFVDLKLFEQGCRYALALATHRQ